MSTDREPAFWTCDDTVERLDHEDKDDAIEEYLDGLLGPHMTVAEVIAALPEELEVFGYARMEATLPYHTHPLEDLLLALDEEYGDPDGPDREPTPEMIEAEKAFLAVVLEEYQPWACEQVCTETVNTMEWVKTHRTDWLEEVKP
jgi:hypothetical protein